MKNYRLSNHIIIDREERYLTIATQVGFGEVVDEIPTKERRRISLTSTGVAIIKAPRGEGGYIVTVYCPTPRTVSKWYGSRMAVPLEILAATKRNEKRGWTSL